MRELRKYTIFEENDNQDIIKLPFKYVNGRDMKINEFNLLDQYFTKEHIAKYLYNKSREVILKYEANLDNFHWIEPSAGNGVFFNLLPKKNRVGIDINPLNNEIIKQDYFKYNLSTNQKNIVIGNPPFGHRGVVALDFINHSQNAEYVCFILPMFFESKGKGSIKYRVKGLNLIHSEKLPKNSFYTPHNNKDADINCVFQVWSKNNKLNNNDFSWYKNRKNEPFGEYIKVFTVSLAKNRECGKKWIFDEKADFYISSTFYKDISIVDSFDEVKYKSGIAVVITHKNQHIKHKILEIFTHIDWKKYGSHATNSCYHIGKSHIFQVFQDNIKKLNTL